MKEDFLLVEQKENDDLPDIKVRKVKRLVIVLSWRQAATVQGVVALKRSQAAATVTEHELDQLLSKAFWEFLNRYRNWSAKKLNLRDADLVLADIGLMGLEIGGKKVFNPLGFRGGDFVVNLKGTFVSRELLGRLEYLRGKAEEYTIVEQGGLFFRLLSKRSPQLVFCGDDQTAVFGLSRTEIFFRKEIDWGYRQILKEFEKALAVDEETARGLMKPYVQDLMSPAMKRFFNQIWQNQFAKFSRQLGLPDASFVFSFELPAVENWAEKFRRRSSPSLAELAKNPADFVSWLDSDRHAEYNYLNQLLKRRARWLIPNF